MLKQYICSKNFVVAKVWIGPKPATRVAYAYFRSKETLDMNWKSRFIQLCNMMQDPSILHILPPAL